MSYPVPVFDLNGGSRNASSPWEVIAAMNCGNGGFGGNNAWAMMMPFWLLFMLGWGGYGGFGGFGGFGGRGGFGGGCCNGGGFSNIGADLAVSSATETAEIKAGINYIAQTQVGQTNLLGQVKDNIFAGFANLNNAVTTAGYQNQLGQRDLQKAISDCCCTTQSNIANSTNALTQQLCQLNYNLAMQTCELKQAIAAEGDATRKQAQIMETERLRAALAKAEQENFMLQNCKNCD